MNVSQPTAPPPTWLPDWMLGVWALFAEHPFVLASLIVLGGGGFAVLARVFVLFWGLKVARRTATDLDEKLVRLGAFVAALFILYLSLMAAVQTLPFGERATTVLTQVVVSFLVLQLIRVGLQASHIGLAILSYARHRFPIVEERTIPVFDLVATVMIVAIAAYALLQIWNIDATAWLASAGVVGIAVGFAAKDTLANLFAGFFIIADTPYKVGDYVVLDTGERGEVTRVGIRSTRILTRDDIEIIVPNSQMANFKVVNESGGRSTKVRIRIKVGVAYGSDVDHVVAVLEDVAQVHESVCRDPAARARMRGFGDSSLDFELLCWVEHPSQRGLVSHELYMDIHKRLRSEGIEIPFPQRDVWMRRTPGLEGGEDAGKVSGPPG
ncbi:MAG: mechanosensitive ion channel family protein [Gemmatimonadota bacterium]